jgi:hypothetical protein
MDPIFDLIPQRRFLEALFHLFLNIGFVLYTVYSEAVSHVFKNAFWKGIGFLKNHSNVAPEGHHIHIRPVDILIIQEDVSLDAARGNQIIHAVQAAQ